MGADRRSRMRHGVIVGVACLVVLLSNAAEATDVQPLENEDGGLMLGGSDASKPPVFLKKNVAAFPGETAAMKACVSSCTGKCRGVSFCGPCDGKPATCKKSYKSPKLGEGVEVMTPPSCVEQCKARGAVCHGVYLSRGSNECHMILSKPGPAGGNVQHGVAQGGAGNKGIHIHFHNDPNPAAKNTAAPPVISTGPNAIAAKKAIKKATKKAVKKAVKKAKKKDAKKLKKAIKKAKKDSKKSGKKGKKGKKKLKALKKKAKKGAKGKKGKKGAKAKGAKAKAKKLAKKAKKAGKKAKKAKKAAKKAKKGAKKAAKKAKSKKAAKKGVKKAAKKKAAKKAKKKKKKRL